MTVHNQFRIKSIPKQVISEGHLLNIVRDHCNVLDDFGNVLRVKYRYGANLADIWDVYVEDKGGVYDLVGENDTNPWTTFGAIAVFSGRKLLCKIERLIEVCIQ